MAANNENYQTNIANVGFTIVSMAYLCEKVFKYFFFSLH
jgi:hypothetical protein